MHDLDPPTARRSFPRVVRGAKVDGLPHAVIRERLPARVGQIADCVGANDDAERRLAAVP
jgi:hypothetical protein